MFTFDVPIAPPNTLFSTASPGQGPSPLVRAMHASKGEPAASVVTPVHSAPLRSCVASCIAPGHELKARNEELALAPDAVEQLDPRLPADLAACLGRLRADYSICGANKQQIDAAFALCAEGPSEIEEVPSWWFENLQLLACPCLPL